MCGALRDLVPFVQFKKREKHPWRSFNFSKVAGFKCSHLCSLVEQYEPKGPKDLIFLGSKPFLC